MAKTKIQVGHGTGKRGYGKKGMYGGKSTGKRNSNGGFGGCVNVSYSNLEQDKWDEAFPNGFKPSWDK